MEAARRIIIIIVLLLLVPLFRNAVGPVFWCRWCFSLCRPRGGRPANNKSERSKFVKLMKTYENLLKHAPWPCFKHVPPFEGGPPECRRNSGVSCGASAGAGQAETRSSHCGRCCGQMCRREFERRMRLDNPVGFQEQKGKPKSPSKPGNIRICCDRPVVELLLDYRIVTTHNVT